MNTQCQTHIEPSQIGCNENPLTTATLSAARLAEKIIGKLRNQYQIRKQRRIDRDAFNRLVTLDESALKDIGITRADVLWASQLPLSVNASLELEKIARAPKIL